MEQTINGLPIGFFVIAGGIILVLAAWVLMRFGKVIARAVLTIAAVVIGGIVALAVLAQGAASFQTAQSAERVAKVAQTSATSNLVLVAGVGCFGGVAVVAVIGAVGVALCFWVKSHQVQKPTQLTTPRQSAALPEPQPSPVVWIVGDGQQSAVNLDGVDFSQWGW